MEEEGFPGSRTPFNDQYYNSNNTTPSWNRQRTNTFIKRRKKERKKVCRYFLLTQICSFSNVRASNGTTKHKGKCIRRRESEEISDNGVATNSTCHGFKSSPESSKLYGRWKCWSKIYFLVDLGNCPNRSSSGIWQTLTMKKIEQPLRLLG